MRDVPASLQHAWVEGLFVGDRKATARVTVQHPTMVLRNYSMLKAHGSTVTGDGHLHAATVDVNTKRTTTLATKAAEAAAAQAAAKAKKKYLVNQTYADFLFTTMGKPMELPNLRSVEWNRSIDSDVADCTITVLNTAELPPGTTPLNGDLDLPGYYTFDRGGANFAQSRWGYTRNPWFGMIVPDNLIRTYEGYGSDLSVPAEDDPHLVLTGVWMIDSVDYGSDGQMSIKCRDIGRLLLDQMCYPPVCPKDFYDKPWNPWPGPVKNTTTTITNLTNKLKLTPEDSSNTPWIGSGVVQGHTLAMAFDGNPNTYWLSIGNIAPSRRFAYEWVQAKVNNTTVTTVKVRTKKKGYGVYLSLMVGGQWIGARTIDYHRDGIGMNGGNIKYHAYQDADTEEYITFTLDKPVAKVQRIRVTVANLQDFHFGLYQYRGAIRDVEAFGNIKIKDTSTTTTVTNTGPAGSNPGRYKDYTDIIKLLCAWGGFFWPKGGRQRISDATGSYESLEPTTYDTTVLGKGVKGRVWGDFMQSGTTGVAELDWSNFDKKPLMDGISYIRDILGFLFFIDETGGVQWRMPNIYNFGCYVGYGSAKPGYHKGSHHTIDERTILLSLDATIDSKNVRESIFVGQVAGKIGAFAPGYNPNPTGIRRMGGWTDQDFATVAECQRMADYISLAGLQTYRTERIKIPANPKMQIDDQVRILERSSAEGYLHYIQSIASSLDIESGEWTYDLATHWLGEDPSTKWLFNPQGQFHAATISLLNTQLDLQGDYGKDRT